MYGFTLILTLAIVGGVIAFLGDKIGMKVGRKRLTLFGLRPKYTGIIITIFTGIFIAVSSIAVLTIVSNDVRTALFRMKTIQEELLTSQRELEETLVLMSNMEKSLQEMVQGRDQAERELFEAQLALKQVTSQYNILLEDLEAAKKAVAKEREQVDIFREASELLQERVRELEIRRTNLQEQLNQLFDEFISFERRVRFSELAFKADEIIFAQTVEGGASLEETSRKVVEFLNRADKVALQRGARTEPDSGSAIKLHQHTFDLVVHSLQRKEGLFVLRAVSETNTVVGEPVIAYLELIPNQLIYLQGSVIAERDIDLSITQDISHDLYYLLNTVSEIVVQKGMITIDGAAVEVSSTEFFSTMDAVKDYSGIITVQAKAAHDVWTAEGPLEIVLDIIQKDK